MPDAITVTPPLVGPCAPWATATDVASCASCSKLEIDEDVLAQALSVASEVLYIKSGRQYPGQCTVTVRPCCTEGNCAAGIWTPALIAGQWYNLTSTADSPCLGYNCGGGALPTIDLGDRFPVTGIVEVLIDGVALAPAKYRLDEWRYLRRIDGQSWPAVNDFMLPKTSAGTWSIELRYGQPVPEMAKLAAIEFACELAKNIVNDGSCRLPQRVTNVSRQGVTYSLANVMDVVDRGLTGLYYVDLFIKVSNPNALEMGPTVVQLDRPAPPRVLG